MSSIGNFDFLSMRGEQIPRLAIRVRAIERPGVDGATFRQEAEKAGEIIIRTVEGITDQSTANGRIDDYQQIIDDKVTVVDDMGRSTSDVKVMFARVTGVQKMLTSAPSDVKYLVHGEWTLKPTR